MTKMSPMFRASAPWPVTSVPQGLALQIDHIRRGLVPLRRIEVGLGGRSLRAAVRGRDVATDLALLHADQGGLPFASLGDSNELLVGQLVDATNQSVEKTIHAEVTRALARYDTVTNTLHGRGTEVVRAQPVYVYREGPPHRKIASSSSSEVAVLLLMLALAGAACTVPSAIEVESIR